MRRIRQVLQLHFGARASARMIGRTVGVARSTVQDNLNARPWPGLRGLWLATSRTTFLNNVCSPMPASSAVLAARADGSGLVARAQAAWRQSDGVVGGVSRGSPGGYGYSRFCDLFREFERRLSPTMRQDHPAGDKVFVDYSGKKIMIVDRATGVVREAEIFVAVLGASNYTYAEATWTQKLADWIEAHVRMFRFFGGVPRLVVPDNLKSGVHRASFYDPEINRSYGMMASHYGVGILPARPRKPRDKAKVEAGVRFAQTYILGRLRRQTFFSLAEANAAIAAALERINAHVMRRLSVSRRQLFETVEMAVLAPLPDADYQFAEWRVARVSLDYHVDVDGFFYSVPHGLIREQVDVRATTRTIELFHRGLRVAAHQRRYGGRRHGTDPVHMPSAHRRYAEWTPDRFRRWGRSIGPNTEGLVLAILANRPHPEQGFRTCLGVLRLFKDIDPERAELIAARAVAVSALTYKSIASIIANKLERSSRDTEDAIIEHPNLRGPGYFH